LCDLATGDVGQATLGHLGLSRASLPASRPAGTPAGRLLPRAARALGLIPGVVVAVAAHDQYAASLGAGCTEPGDLLLSAGTAWVLLLTADRRVTDRASSFYPSRHVEPGRWGVLASIATGNTTLDRVLALTGQRRDWPRLTAAVEAVPPGSDGVLVLPHLVGRSAPTWDEDARGAILGLSTGHTRAHVWRAAMEGLAFDAKRVCEYLAGHDAGLHSLRMVGGAARSTVWPSIVASVLGVPVMTCAGENLAVRGAACLGARAAGLPDLPLATDWQTHLPRAEWGEAYQRAYVRYCEMVRRLERAT
jgi:sugar (pentulose or hexulose) kinase